MGYIEYSKKIIVQDGYYLYHIPELSIIVREKTLAECNVQMSEVINKNKKILNDLGIKINPTSLKKDFTIYSTFFNKIALAAVIILITFLCILISLGSAVSLYVDTSYNKTKKKKKIERAFNSPLHKKEERIRRL